MGNVEFDQENGERDLLQRVKSLVYAPFAAHPKIPELTGTGHKSCQQQTCETTHEDVEQERDGGVRPRPVVGERGAEDRTQCREGEEQRGKDIQSMGR